MLLQSMPLMSGADDFASEGVPQNLKEYDPEWARAFASGSVTASCVHLTMLQQVKVPVLFTHHFHRVDEETDHLLGAISDIQVAAVRRTIEATGQSFTYASFPRMPHSIHSHDPERYASTVHDWISGLSR